MILGYRDRRTERFANGQLVKDLQGVEHQATKRLAILNAAPSLGTSRTLPRARQMELQGGSSHGLRIDRASH